jgi:hypothetical protein
MLAMAGRRIGHVGYRFSGKSVALLVIATVLMAVLTGPVGDQTPRPETLSTSALSVLNTNAEATPSVSWHNITAAVAPPGGFGTMTYDAADGYILYFGTAAGSLAPETWSFSAGRWSQLHPAEEPPPAATPIVFDASDGYVVLYGNGEWNSSSFYSQTWTFHGGNWTNITSQSSAVPPARTNAAMAYDANRGEVVLYGGYCGGQCPSHYSDVQQGDYNDTWQFHAGAWTQLSTSQSPPAMQGASMAFDPSGGGVILYGGDYAWQKIIVTGNSSSEKRGTAVSTGTWRFNGSWANLSASPPDSPNLGGDLVQDNAFGGDILFGGYDSIPGTIPPATTFSNATWGWTGSSWFNLSLSIAPSDRSPGPIAYDPAGGYVLLFGGTSSTGQGVLNDTWTLNTSGFVPLQAVWFTASGLKSGANWSVELIGSESGLSIEISPSLTKWSYGGTRILFEVSPGTYSYTAASAGYRSISGSVQVTATSQSTVPIGFVAGGPNVGAAPPDGIVWVGLGIIVVATAGLLFALHRARLRRASERADFIHRLSESEWVANADGEPELWKP